MIRMQRWNHTDRPWHERREGEDGLIGTAKQHLRIVVRQDLWRHSVDWLRGISRCREAFGDTT